MSDRPTWSVVDNVQAARNPQEAILVLAQALDEILDLMRDPPALVNDGWGEWSESLAKEDLRNERIYVERRIDEDTLEVELKPVDPEKQKRRMDFASKVLRLEEAAPEIGLEPEQAVETYGKGGPLWLYQNRDLFMQYPIEVRRAMVADVDEDDSITAQEMARDALRDVDDDAGSVMARVSEAFDRVKDMGG